MRKLYIPIESSAKNINLCLGKEFMVDLDILQNLLKNATPPNPTENTSEELFDQIVTFIEQEKINEATGLIEKIFAKGIPDVRLIVYYFYAHFTNYGIKSFIGIFPGIISMVNEYWDVLRPLNRKDKQVQSSLNWFFSHILIKIKYSEKLHNTGKMHPIWKKSVLEVSSDELNNLISIANEFKNFFIEKWPKSSTKDRVLHLVKKIEELKPLIIEEVKPQDSNENNIEVEKEEDKQEEEVNQVVIKVSSKEVEVAPIPEFHQPIEQVSTEISEATSIPQETKLAALSNAIVNEERLLSLEKLDDFSRKLKVFELLISQNNYLKAAVVAKDIDHLLENFDPLNYFPKLFAKYFSLFAKHVAALSEQYENKESLQVKHLEKLYRADLDMFIDW